MIVLVNIQPKIVTDLIWEINSRVKYITMPGDEYIQ